MSNLSAKPFTLFIVDAVVTLSSLIKKIQFLAMLNSFSEILPREIYPLSGLITDTSFISSKSFNLLTTLQRAL